MTDGTPAYFVPVVLHPIGQAASCIVRAKAVAGCPATTRCTFDRVLLTYGQPRATDLQCAGTSSEVGTAGTTLSGGVAVATNLRSSLNSLSRPSVAVTRLSNAFTSLTSSRCSNLDGLEGPTASMRCATAAGATDEFAKGAAVLDAAAPRSHPAKATAVKWYGAASGALRMYVRTVAEPHRANNAMVCSESPALDRPCAPVARRAWPE